MHKELGEMTTTSVAWGSAKLIFWSVFELDSQSGGVGSNATPWYYTLATVTTNNSSIQYKTTIGVQY